jgi:diamine N-acetyltransferase
MLYDPTRTPAPEDRATCYLWRFMIDARHQRRGYGAAALAQLIAHARTLAGVRSFALSYVPAADIRATSTRASVSPSPVKWMRTKS